MGDEKILLRVSLRELRERHGITLDLTPNRYQFVDVYNALVRQLSGRHRGPAGNSKAGNGNNGTLGASAASGSDDPQWTTGKVGGALEFDGVDDYVDCGSDASLDLSTTDFSIEVWFKTLDTAEQWFFRESFDTGNTICFRIMNNGLYSYGTPTADDGWDTGTGATTVTDGKWHHAILVVSRGNYARIYLDGIKDVEDTSVGTADLGNVSSSWIGRESSILHYFNGTIDEVRIYNRALSAEEIRYHYNRGGPVAYWKFDEGSGSVINDYSINNNTGTLHLGTSGNTTTSNAWVTGKHGSALSFDGVDDYVDCGNDESLDITDAITIEAWVKPVLDSDFRTIVAHDMWYHWGMRKGNNNSVCCHMRYSDGSRCQSLYIPALTAEWQHIAFTWDKTVASNNAKAYKNGVLVDVATCGVGLDLHAPRWGLNIGSPFNGAIDEVRIYNRALSAAEIRKHYAAGAAKHGIAINDR